MLHTITSHTAHTQRISQRDRPWKRPSKAHELSQPCSRISLKIIIRLICYIIKLKCCLLSDFQTLRS